MSNVPAFKQLLDAKESNSHKTLAVVNRGDCIAVWNPLTEEKLSASKATSKEDFLSVQLVHNAANTVVVSPGVKDTVIRLFNNERLSETTKGISEQTLKDVSLTYITPEKLFGHRGSMAGEDGSGSDVFQYLGAYGSKLVSFTIDSKMKDGVVRSWSGAPELKSSKEFTSYKGIEQIVPLARRTGFVARCGDGFIRRYDQTVQSLSAAAQPRAKAKFYLSDRVPAGRDTFITFVSVKADGKWMVVTTSAAIYLTNWVDDDVTDEDFVVAELGLDPTVKIPDFGDYEYHAAKFDSSVEDDVTNPDMCEKHIGAFITPGEDATYTGTVMVQWRLRDVFKNDKHRIDNKIKRGLKLVQALSTTPKPTDESQSTDITVSERSAVKNWMTEISQSTYKINANTPISITCVEWHSVGSEKTLYRISDDKASYYELIKKYARNESNNLTKWLNRNKRVLVFLT